MVRKVVKGNDHGLRGRVEMRMHELGMNQRQLVEKSGLSQAVISHIQNKRILMLDAVNMIKLADALECDVRWLATGERAE